MTNYNQGKVGTDRMDQMIAMLYFKNRFRWHVKCFIPFLYIILNITHVIWKEIRDPWICRKLHFVIMLLVHELCVVEKLWVTHDDNHDAVTMHAGHCSQQDRAAEETRQMCVLQHGQYCSMYGDWIHIDGHAEGTTCWNRHHRS